MKRFLDEQDTASKPPEPRGEQTPKKVAQRILEEESGETLLDETMPKEKGTAEENEEQVEWDGSEAELVADESAAEYEEQHTGIQLKYSLRSKEIFSTLMKTQYTQIRIALSAAAVLLSAVLAAVFLVQLSTTGNSSFASLASVCILLIFVIVLIPIAKIRQTAQRAADGHEIKMKIYPDHIEMGQEKSSWEIPLDGTKERTVLPNLIILYIDEKNLVILPLRCVEPAVLPEVQAMIFAGTQPKNNRDYST